MTLREWWLEAPLLDPSERKSSRNTDRLFAEWAA